jgi:hypothetical protein
LHWESLVMVRYSLPLMKGDRLNRAPLGTVG